MKKLLLCELLASCRNGLLQCKIRLRTIYPFLKPCMGGSFMHRAIFYSTILTSLTELNHINNLETYKIRLISEAGWI